MIYMILSAIAAYFIGSINFSILLSQKMHGKDIRQEGSGNAGATNMLRTFGKKEAAAVLLFDISKGIISVGIAKLLILLFAAPYASMLVAGFFVQLGHCLPIFHKFKGGKGVAAAAGSAIAVMPLVAAILLVLFAFFVIITKTVSLSSGICAAVYPVLAYFLSGDNRIPNLVFAASCSVMIIIFHTKNIARLLDGEEKTIL